MTSASGTEGAACTVCSRLLLAIGIYVCHTLGRKYFNHALELTLSGNSIFCQVEACDTHHSRELVLVDYAHTEPKFDTTKECMFSSRVLFFQMLRILIPELAHHRLGVEAEPTILLRATKLYPLFLPPSSPYTIACRAGTVLVPSNAVRYRSPLPSAYGLHRGHDRSSAVRQG